MSMKVSELPSESTLVGTDEFLITKSGSTRTSVRSTLDSLQAFINRTRAQSTTAYSSGHKIIAESGGVDVELTQAQIISGLSRSLGTSQVSAVGSNDILIRGGGQIQRISITNLSNSIYPSNRASPTTQDEFIVKTGTGSSRSITVAATQALLGVGRPVPISIAGTALETTFAGNDRIIMSDTSRGGNNRAITLQTLTDGLTPAASNTLPPGAQVFVRGFSGNTVRVAPSLLGGGGSTFDPSLVSNIFDNTADGLLFHDATDNTIKRQASSTLFSNAVPRTITSAQTVTRLANTDTIPFTSGTVLGKITYQNLRTLIGGGGSGTPITYTTLRTFADLDRFTGIQAAGGANIQITAEDFAATLEALLASGHDHEGRNIIGTTGNPVGSEPNFKEVVLKHTSGNTLQSITLANLSNFIHPTTTLSGIPAADDTILIYDTNTSRLRNIPWATLVSRLRVALGL